MSSLRRVVPGVRRIVTDTRPNLALLGPLARNSFVAFLNASARLPRGDVPVKDNGFDLGFLADLDVLILRQAMLEFSLPYIKVYAFRQGLNIGSLGQVSPLIVPAQFLKPRIAAQRIKHGIEAEQRGSDRRPAWGRQRDCFP